MMEKISKKSCLYYKVKKTDRHHAGHTMSVVSSTYMLELIYSILIKSNTHKNNISLFTLNKQSVTMTVQQPTMCVHKAFVSRHGHETL